MNLKERLNFLIFLLLIFNPEFIFATLSCEQIRSMAIDKNGSEENPFWHQKCVVGDFKFATYFTNKNLELIDLILNTSKPYSFEQFKKEFNKLKSEGKLEFNDVFYYKDDQSKIHLGTQASILEAILGDLLDRYVQLEIYFYKDDHRIELEKYNPDTKYISYYPQELPFLPVNVAKELRHLSMEYLSTLKLLKSMDPHQFICKVRQSRITGGVDLSGSLADDSNFSSVEFLNAIDGGERLGYEEFFSDLSNEDLDRSKDSLVYKVLEKVNLISDTDFKNYPCSYQEVVKTSKINDPLNPFSKVINSCLNKSLQSLINSEPNPLREGFHIAGTGSGECYFLGSNWEVKNKFILNFTGRLVENSSTDKFKSVTTDFSCPLITISTNNTTTQPLLLDASSCFPIKQDPAKSKTDILLQN